MGISEYKQAQAAMDDDKFYLAEALLKGVKARLSTQPEQKQNVSDVTRQMARVSLHLKKHQQTTECLQEIIRGMQHSPQDTPSPLVYKEYLNLFLHLLHTDLPQAILLGRALNSPSETKHVPPVYQKQFRMLLGVSYLCDHQYGAAVHHLQTMMSSQPNPILSAMGTNNLAVAFWLSKQNFHRHPPPSHLTPAQSAAYYTQVDSNFSNTIPLFKKSLFLFEQLPASSDANLLPLLTLLLDPKETVHPHLLGEDLPNLLNSTYSAKPLWNLVSCLLRTQPDQEMQGRFWLKQALLHFRSKEESQRDKVLSLVALLERMYQNLETSREFYLQALETQQHSDSYERVNCMLQYSRLLEQMGLSRESQQTLQEAE